MSEARRRSVGVIFNKEDDQSFSCNPLNALENPRRNGQFQQHFVSLAIPHHHHELPNLDDLNNRLCCGSNAEHETGSSFPHAGDKLPEGEYGKAKYVTLAERLSFFKDMRDMRVLHLETSVVGKNADWLVKQIKRMKQCAQGACVGKDPNTGREILQSFRRCGVKTCPICAWRKSLKTAAMYTARLDAFLAEHPTHTVRNITLTAPPVSLFALGDQCSRLGKAFTAVYNAFPHPFVGYLRCIDVAMRPRNPNAFEAPMMVLPHIHAIMIQRPKNSRSYVKNGELETAWTKAMGSPIPLHTKIKDAYSPFGAIKYASKTLQWPKAEVADDYDYQAALACAYHGIRCTMPGGVLRAKKQA